MIYLFSSKSLFYKVEDFSCNILIFRGFVLIMPHYMQIFWFKAVVISTFAE